jgi:hypothetical protein
MSEYEADKIIADLRRECEAIENTAIANDKIRQEQIKQLEDTLTDANKENATLMQDNSDLKQKVIDLTLELEKVKGEK